jgi:hypothetical protein
MENSLNVRPILGLSVRINLRQSTSVCLKDGASVRTVEFV